MATTRPKSRRKIPEYLRQLNCPPAASNGVKVISFFTGAGGLDLGFHQAGYDIQYCGDIEQVFCDSLAANVGGYVSAGARIEPADIRDLRLRDLPRNPDLVIGGPPCQSFSASGRRAGGAAGRLDDRGTLFGAYRDLIDQLKPAAFLFENVRGILGTHGGKDWREIQAAFSEIGYTLSLRILDACDYGAPQHRERLFLVGQRLSVDFLFPKPIKGPDSSAVSSYSTPSECLANIDHSGEDIDSLMLSEGKYCHLLPEVPPGDNYLFFTAKRGHPNPKFAYRSRFSDFLYKANPDFPIKTLIASPGKYTGPLHWDNRYFSMAEYKRLQGFPDSYEFCGSRSDVVRQIGNSVSPPIALRLAEAIGQQIFGLKYNVELLSPDEDLTFDKRKSRKAQKTRIYHQALSTNNSHKVSSNFKLENYTSSVGPSDALMRSDNVKVTIEENSVHIKVRGDKGRKTFARMQLLVHGSHPERHAHASDSVVRVHVAVYGTGPHCIQTMWNAVDNWVIRSRESLINSCFQKF